MNVRRYKCPVSSPASIGGRRLELRPLSTMAVDRAVGRARARFVALGADPVGGLYELGEALQVLSEASGCPTEELSRGLYPEHIWQLYAAWGRLQQQHQPDLDKLAKHLKWGVAHDPEIAADGVAAFVSRSPAEFYGAPTAELTIGQMAYYLLVRAAHQEVHVSEKKVSKRWLETLRQD